MEFIFASSNPGKLREVKDICTALEKKYGLHIDVFPMPEKVDIPETGATYEENALIKARWVWKRYGKNCFADDSGLEVEALGGAPGIHTARFCNRDFSSGIDGLVQELKACGAERPEQRKASFECCICLILNGEPVYFHGHCPGIIGHDRRGCGGFGFDPIFIADATPEFCMAELEESRKNSISHRGLAMEQMFRYLANEKHMK